MKEEEKCTAGCCHYDEKGKLIGMCGLNHCNHPHCHTQIREKWNHFDLRPEIENPITRSKAMPTHEEIADWWINEFSTVLKDERAQLAGEIIEKLKDKRQFATPRTQDGFTKSIEVVEEIALNE